MEEFLFLLVDFLVFGHHEVVKVPHNIDSLRLRILNLSRHFRRLLISTSYKLLLFNIPIFILIKYHLLVLCLELFLFILLLRAVITECLKLAFWTLYLKWHTWKGFLFVVSNWFWIQIELTLLFYWSMRYYFIPLFITFDLMELLAQIVVSFLSKHFWRVLFLKCLQDSENFTFAHQTFVSGLQLEGVFREGTGVVFWRLELLTIKVKPKRILSGVYLRKRLLLIRNFRARVRLFWII